MRNEPIRNCYRRPVCAGFSNRSAQRAVDSVPDLCGIGLAEFCVSVFEVSDSVEEK
jgi:hypothetical protein